MKVETRKSEHQKPHTETEIQRTHTANLDLPSIYAQAFYILLLEQRAVTAQA